MKFQKPPDMKDSEARIRIGTAAAGIIGGGIGIVALLTNPQLEDNPLLLASSPFIGGSIGLGGAAAVEVWRDKKHKKAISRLDKTYKNSP